MLLETNLTVLIEKRLIIEVNCESKILTMRLLFTALACLISLSVFGQNDFKSYRQTYFESNFGVALLSEKYRLFDIWPGYSFLGGRRKFYSRNKFTDAQIGLALPTGATAKIAVGKYNFNKETSSSFGLRIWPAHIYIQHSRPSHKISERRERRFINFFNSSPLKPKNVICGEWNFSIEVGGGDISPTLRTASFFSVAMVTIGYRTYINLK
ncbi:MAG: hypothetical protein CL823_01420 [Crocinitomicaceae bacterium]|nr:hypothetical protein [Crocinitomicaceae bacterium]